MENLNPDQKFVLGIGLILAASFIAVAALESAQQNNQVVRPFPEPAPVVPELPDIIAVLRQSHDLSEGRASAAKTLLRRRRGGESELARGRWLYDDARAEFNGCIDYLRAGLSRRFAESDAPRIAARIAASKRKVDAFVTWSNSLERQMYGDFDPYDALLQALDRWLNQVRQQNDQAIEQLRADLDRCRIAPWNEIPFD